MELKQQMYSLAQKTGRAAFGVIFPDVCLSCGNHVTKQGVVCSQCWSQLYYIEKPYCEILGTPFGMDFGPSMVSAQAIAKPPDFTRARSATVHVNIAKQLVSRLKYGDRNDLAPWMAGWMIRAGTELIEETDVVIPIPLHRTRYFMRRYNQAAELARVIATKNDLEYAPDCVVRSKSTKKQVGLNPRQREENVRNAFNVRPENEIKIRGKTVLIIDDVLTTGATANAMSRALLKAGSTKVNLLTFSQVVPGFIEKKPIRT